MKNNLHRALSVTVLMCSALLMFSPTTSAQPIGEMLTVTTQFREVIEPAGIWIEIRDPNAGATRPLFLRLDQRTQTQVFATYANDFVIQRIWLEFDDGGVIKPCAHNRDIISNQSVEIHLTGMLGSMIAPPHCHLTHHNTPPIQQSLKPKKIAAKQELTTEQPINTEEGRYYAALKDCKPSAFRFTAYQPFLDEQSETLLIIDGEQDNRCSVQAENHSLSPQGKDVTAITKCRFTTATRESMTAKNIAILMQASHSNEISKGTFYAKAMCSECSATAEGKNLKCFEKSPTGTAAGAAAIGTTSATTTVTTSTNSTANAPAPKTN